MVPVLMVHLTHHYEHLLIRHGDGQVSLCHNLQCASSRAAKIRLVQTYSRCREVILLTNAYDPVTAGSYSMAKYCNKVPLFYPLFIVTDRLVVGISKASLVGTHELCKGLAETLLRTAELLSASQVLDAKNFMARSQHTWIH
jgi:hypothetical protein